MPNTPTPILGLTVPTVGADNNAWGNEINGNLAIIDFLGALEGDASSVGRTLSFGVFPIKMAFETGGVGGITDLLPSAVGKFGKGFFVKKVDPGPGAVTLATLIAGQTIDGFPTYPIVNQNQFLCVVSDGANWQIVWNN